MAKLCCQCADSNYWLEEGYSTDYSNMLSLKSDEIVTENTNAQFAAGFAAVVIAAAGLSYFFGKKA